MEKYPKYPLGFPQEGREELGNRDGMGTGNARPLHTSGWVGDLPQGVKFGGQRPHIPLISGFIWKKDSLVGVPVSLPSSRMLRWECGDSRSEEPAPLAGG